mmetsp:Transcript_28891/g.33233  ORF Transcript_28891/g.33233 Transcript_28891/m.33233 type:complete len:110 (-) Transcript_28891:1570-1899(-)
MRIGGLRKIARAIATLCFCPPDNLLPRCPTGVSYPSGKFDMNSCALALFAASITSSSVADGLPYRMFSFMLISKSKGSWFTTPIHLRRSVSLISRRSHPSRRMRPPVGS